MKKFWIIAVAAASMLFVSNASLNAADAPAKGKKAQKSAKADKGDPGQKKPAREQLLDRYDKDGNGKIDDSEMAALKKDFEAKKVPVLAKLDRNKDGKLDDKELALLNRAGKAKERKKGKAKE